MTKNNTKLIQSQMSSNEEYHQRRCFESSLPEKVEPNPYIKMFQEAYNNTPNHILKRGDATIKLTKKESDAFKKYIDGTTDNRSRKE